MEQGVVHDIRMAWVCYQRPAVATELENKRTRHDYDYNYYDTTTMILLLL